MPTRTIKFESKGQAFLEWDINAALEIVACRPRESRKWVGAKLIASVFRNGKIICRAPHRNYVGFVDIPFQIVNKEAA